MGKSSSIQWLLPAFFVAAAWGTGSARAEDGMVSFHTPSGNIQCLAIEGDEGNMVDCEISEVTTITLPQTRPADCDLEWGNRFELTDEGKTEMICYGDTLRDPDGQVIAYGKSYSMPNITCVSEKTGLTCTNSSGHGFMLSKERQEVF